MNKCQTVSKMTAVRHIGKNALRVKNMQEKVGDGGLFTRKMLVKGQ